MADCHCICCGRTVWIRYWVCADCAKAFELDRPFGDWPEWARQAKRDEQRERHDNRRWEQNTEPLPDEWD